MVRVSLDWPVELRLLLRIPVQLSLTNYKDCSAALLEFPEREQSGIRQSLDGGFMDVLLLLFACILFLILKKKSHKQK